MSTIPAAVVQGLRGALYHQLGGTAEDLAALSYEPPAGRLYEWSEPIARFDRARALLDRIGWVAPDPERDVQIDLDRHRRVIADALANELVTFRSLASEKGKAAKDQRREARARVARIEAFVESAGVDVVHEPEQRITVPEDFLGLLTEALLSDMQDAAQGVERAGARGQFDRVSYLDALERFDSIRALLVALGWGTVAEIDMDPHRDVLQRALAGRLETEHCFMDDAKECSTAEGAERQYKRAHAYALQLEAFMRDAALEIPDAGDTH